MIENQMRSKCSRLMKKIPIKKLESSLMIEFYCDKCDGSITYYSEFDRNKLERAEFFKIRIFFIHSCVK